MTDGRRQRRGIGEALKDEIARLYREGLTHAAIGARVGRSAGTICSALRPLRRGDPSLRRREVYASDGVTPGSAGGRGRARKRAGEARETRPCLRCRKSFEAAHRFNRLCPGCATLAADVSPMAP